MGAESRSCTREEIRESRAIRILISIHGGLGGLALSTREENQAPSYNNFDVNPQTPRQSSVDVFLYLTSSFDLCDTRNILAAAVCEVAGSTTAPSWLEQMRLMTLAAI